MIVFVEWMNERRKNWKQADAGWGDEAHRLWTTEGPTTVLRAWSDFEIIRAASIIWRPQCAGHSAKP